MNRLFAFLHAGQSETPDCQLLDRFHTERDEAAFSELVRRYGPVVWGVCRRSLFEPGDAEDAFQATFLILANRAKRLRNHPAIGPWLYRVATLTVRNLRRSNRRRAAVTGRLDHDVSAQDPATDRTDARLDIDAALAGLPDKYRTPVVLCHLQGLTRREAAARLGWPEGTLSAVLAEALRKLRIRLGGRDPVMVLVAAGTLVVPSVLSAATVRLAGIVAVSNLTAAGVRLVVAALTRKGLRMISVQKAALAVVVALLCGLVLTALGPSRVLEVSAADPPKSAAGPKATGKPAEDDDTKDLVPTYVTGTVKDADGNPIAGARVRMNGTIGYAATFGGTEFNGSAVIEADGAYKLGFKTKPATTVVLTAISASADGYVAHAERFHFDELKTTPDKPGRWDFVLAKGEVIAGRVAPPDNEAGIFLLVRGPSFSERYFTDKDGTFRLWVPKGTYTVTAVVQIGTSVRNPTFPLEVREGLVIKRSVTAERVKSGTENLVLKAP